jgi:hypothetical protein
MCIAELLQKIIEIRSQAIKIGCCRVSLRISLPRQRFNHIVVEAVVDPRKLPPSFVSSPNLTDISHMPAPERR